MGRLARSLLGGLGGILWGAGAAVLVQQFGLWPLDPLLAYGAPLLAAAGSSAWGGRRRGRPPGVTKSTLVTALVLPLALGALQNAGCDASINDEWLSGTSPSDPIEIDPAVDEVVEVAIDIGGRPAADAELWIEFGGIPTFRASGLAGDSLMGSFNLEDNGLARLGGAPGIYHVGGSIDSFDGGCAVEGYVEIKGNPFAAPLAPAAAGALLAGLALTLFAGRKPPGIRPARGGTTHLDGTGATVESGGVSIRSPGLEGEMEVHAPTEEAIRDVAGLSEVTRDAFERHELSAERVVEISDTIESGSAGPDVLDHAGRPAFELELPNPGRGHAQIVLATDESGVVGWHFPRNGAGAIDVLRDADALRYRIMRRVDPVGLADAGHGIARSIRAKVLTSFVFPLLDPAIERAGETFARAWETRRRPYRLRTFTPEDYREDRATDPDWERLMSGRALLFVHGTFSRAHTGFGDLSPERLAGLHELYDGRIFAFDHFTLSDDPRRNVRWFFERLPADVRLELDIICHSRGGLVSRTLAEKNDELGVDRRRVQVGKIVFVATPNAGTVLTEPSYIGDYLDSYTNLLNFVPGRQLVDVFEGLITVVKHVAVGAVAGLEGLQAMRPGGAFLQWLNRPATNNSRYFAVAGDYEPVARGWRRYATNRLLDAVFAEANDLVVPTLGTFGDNGSSHFPIAARHELGQDEGVDHMGYFSDDRVVARILEWLGT